MIPQLGIVWYIVVVLIGLSPVVFFRKWSVKRAGAAMSYPPVQWRDQVD